MHMTKVTKVKQEITKQRNIPYGDFTQQQKTNSEKETEPDMEEAGIHRNSSRNHEQNPNLKI